MSGPLSNLLSTKSAQTTVPQIGLNQLVPLRLLSLKHERTEKGDKFNWEFQTTAPVQQDGGGQINPGDFGSKQFVTMCMWGKDGLEAAVGRTMTSIGKFMDALLGTGDAGNKKGKPERPDLLDPAAAAQNVVQLNPEVVGQLVGQTLLAEFKQKTGGYEGTEIAKVHFPGDKQA